MLISSFCVLLGERGCVYAGGVFFYYLLLTNMYFLNVMVKMK